MWARPEFRAVRKAARLGLLLALVVAGGALALAGALPEGYRGVGDVLRESAALEGREVEIKGTVVEGSLVRDVQPVRFLVGDGGATIDVRWDPALPLPDHEAGGTIEGKNVVVRGVLAMEDGVPYVLAQDMQVGCASKYRPETGAAEGAQEGEAGSSPK